MKRVLSCVLSSLLLSACGNATHTAASATDAPRALLLAGASSGLRVDGEAIPKTLLDAYAQRRGYDLKDPGQLQLAREQLVTLVTLARDALKRGAGNSPQLELDRLELLSGFAIADGLAGLPALDDTLLKQRYDEQITRIGQTEYRISHLLFRNGALAEQAATQLASGRPFADVMADYQNHPEVPEAKEWPWIHLGRIPPRDSALADAIRATPVGQSSGIVITPSGWHLLAVQESRPFSPPDFGALKDSIRQSEERARREQVIEQARKAAQVEGLGG